MKKGLVLEGGGLRCMFTTAILDVFMEHGVRFDGMIGVSAGATFGCNFKSGQRGRALRYNKRFAHDRRYTGLYSWIRTGDLVSRDFAYGEVPLKYDIFDYEAFLSDPMAFYCVCTDVDSGQAVYHHHDSGTVEEFLDWVRASASMPLVSRGVPLEGKVLLDGGIADSIPLQYFQQQGYTRNVVILTQPEGFRKKRTPLAPVFRLFCKYPAITQAMINRHAMYNAQLDYLAAEKAKGHTLVICPEEKLAIGRVEMNPEKMDLIYEIGRKKGEEMLPVVREFLQG